MKIPTKTCLSRRIVFVPVLLTLALVTFLGAPLRANSIAVSFTGNTGFTTVSTSTLGWDFTLNSDVLLTDLGVFDSGLNPNGLSDPHTISVWSSTGTLVTSALLPAGTGTLVNQFRYVSTVPTLLTAGNYVIGVYYPTNADLVAFGAVGLATAPEVTYGRGRAGFGAGFPTGSAANDGFFGPNFQFLTPPLNGVPETGGTFLWLGVAFLAIAGFHFAERRCRSF